MAKRIYTIIGLIALAIMIYFIVNPNTFNSKTTLWVVSVLYSVIVGCLFATIEHSLTIKQKGNLIIYPVVMGILFGILVFIYIYFILPVIVPGFM
jgi:hypothetical protein